MNTSEEDPLTDSNHGTEGHSEKLKPVRRRKQKNTIIKAKDDSGSRHPKRTRRLKANQSKGAVQDKESTIIKSGEWCLLFLFMCFVFCER